MDRIVYLNAGLGIICAFIGAKLLLHAVHGYGAGWPAEIPAWLAVIVGGAVMLITVIAGMISSRRTARQASGNTAPVTTAQDAGAGRRARLTAEERTALARRFAVIDIDGNGVWQRNDYQLLTRRLCETFGHPADSAAGRAVATGQRALFDSLLSHMDADGDQEITQDEFTATVGHAIEDRPGFDTAARTAPCTLLHMADQDGNGELDAGEYARLAAVYAARPDQAARAFGCLDQDRTGILYPPQPALPIPHFFPSPNHSASATPPLTHPAP